jgi:hypothetical protein
MAKRGEKSKRNYMSDAETLERDAYIISRTFGKVGVSDPEAMEFYERAAKKRMKAKQYTEAAGNFHHAYIEAKTVNRRKPNTISQEKMKRLKANWDRMYKLNEGKFRIKKRRVLETRLTSILAIVGFVIGIFFLQPNITGNVIANLNSVTTNGIGAVFLLIGVVGTFLYFRKKNK